MTDTERLLREQVVAFLRDNGLWHFSVTLRGDGGWEQTVYPREVHDALTRPASQADALAEALDDGVATLSAVRATATSDDWGGSAPHFEATCLATIRRMNAALAAHRRQP